MKEYDNAYETKNFFGEKADRLLINHYKKIKTGKKVLDIGIGQGRNAFFLVNKGYLVQGIDPSKVAINRLNEQIHQQNLNLFVFHSTFSEFKPEANTYDAILIFGLIQILSEKQINLLAEKISVCLKNGGLVFLTGFTKKEKTFMPKTKQWEKISEASFSDNQGNFRTFLNASEAADYFKNFKTIHKWEGLGKKHHHGDGQEEQHHYF
ncbi:MAG: hypothetical protein DRJ10_19485, partial [Bacteroidetes bacterium]